MPAGNSATLEIFGLAPKRLGTFPPNLKPPDIGGAPDRHDRSWRLGVIVGCLQLPYLMDVEERVAYCESLLVKEEFDLLVLPAAWSEDGPDSSDSKAIGRAAADAEKFQRYICALSARKHATIVTGVIEAARGRIFQCAIVASLVVLRESFSFKNFTDGVPELSEFQRLCSLSLNRLVDSLSDDVIVPCGRHRGTQLDCVVQ